ncbi:hypothetical protein MMC25_001895 [Agyrium rufum]|nr:hypothetical protein [Agyrium rufum]
MYSVPLTSTTPTPNPISEASRKRQRRDSADLTNSFLSASRSWADDSPSYTTSALNTPGAFSPPPLACSRYQLAGGLDTPGMTSVYLQDEEDTRAKEREVGFRRGRGWSNGGGSLSASATISMAGSGYFPPFLSSLSRKRSYENSTLTTASSSSVSAWSRSIFTAFSSATSSILSFCKAGSFHGFYAGKGPGHALNTIPTPFEEMEKPSTHGDPFQASIWQDIDDTSKNYGPPPSKMTGPFIHTPPPSPGYRPAKRVHCSQEAESPWVMVRSPSSASNAPTRGSGDAGYADESNTTPSHAISSAFTRPQLQHTRSRSSFAGCSPTLRSPYQAPASSASVRSPQPSRSSTSFAQPRPTAAAHPLQSRPSLPRTTSAHRHARHISLPRASMSHKNSGPSLRDCDNLANTPLGTEARQYQEELDRRERDEDKELKRMNARLKALIREGREALGTKVEIEMEDDE